MSAKAWAGSGGDLCLTLGEEAGGLGTGVSQWGPGADRAPVGSLGDKVTHKL